jgi:alcohol dehydrogenase
VVSWLKALVLHAPGDLRLERVEDPRPGPGEVLIRVRRAGICGTDKAFYKGTYRLLKSPLIPGHEVVGEVVEVGVGVDKSLVGCRVTSEINLYCGKCAYCLTGLKTHCPYREVIGITRDGGMAEYMVTRADVVHSVEGLSDAQAAFVEPLAAVVEMLELAPIASGDTVAIVGSGAIAILSARLISTVAKPRLLMAIVRRDSPKARYLEKSGVDELVPLDEALEYTRRKTVEGQGFDYVVEASGSPEGLQLAVELVKPRGVIAAKSTHGALVPVDITKLVVKEAKIVGSRCGPFKRAIELLKRRIVEIEDLVTSVYSLDQGVEAFKKSFERDQVKVHIAT